MATVILKDAVGAEKEYEADKIVLKTKKDNTLGETVFSEGEALEGLEIQLDLSDGDQELSAGDGYLVKNAVIKKPIDLLPENIKKGINIAGVEGLMVGNGQKKTVDLVMAAGDMEVLPDEEYMLSKVIIKKPNTLIPNNIVKGVNIGGVVGSFEVGVELPILKSPTLTKTENTRYDTYAVMSPNENGEFASQLNCFNNGVLITTKEVSGFNGSVDVDDVSLFDDTEGEQTLGFSFSGENFTDSEITEVSTTMYSAVIIPESLGNGYDYPAVKAGSDYNVTIASKDKNENGYLSPEITVTINGEPAIYEWNNNIELEDGSYDGCYNICRCTSGRLNVPNITGPLVINGEMTEKPKLSKAMISNKDGNVEITPPEYAEKVEVFVDGVLFKTMQGVTYEVENNGFTEKGEGSVWTASTLQYGDEFKTMKIKFVAPEEAYPVQIKYLSMVVTTSKQNYAYGVFSEIDTELATDAVDTDDLLAYNFKGNSASECRVAEFLLPAGEHFIVAKKVGIKATSESSMLKDYNTFDIALTGLCKKTQITLNDYEEHVVTAVASAATSLDSEPATLICQLQPTCAVTKCILTVGNIVPAVDQIAVYINDALIDTVDYTGTDWELDLTAYPYHQAEAEVYIKAIGEGIEAASQKIKADLSLPVPEIAVNDGVLEATSIASIATNVAIYIGDELYKTCAYDGQTPFIVDMSDGLINDKAVSTQTWEVVPVSGASYGFALNGNGYYESKNKGVNSSYALCRVNISNIMVIPVSIKVIGADFEINSAVYKVPVDGGQDATVTFNCINYAEANYDFGIMSTLDNTLTASYNVDSSNVYKSFKGSSMSGVQTVEYTVPAGEHFVYVKYRKDNSGHSYNDTFQFKMA